MALAFSDDAFEEACLELEQPQVDGWEHFVSSHGVTIYRLYDEVSGLYEYKIFGILEDVLPEICAEVYMDIEYRKQWDSFVNELYDIEVDGKKLVYWNVNFPFPLWNRDYVFRRELRVLDYQGRKVWVVLVKGDSTPSIPEKSGVVRVDDYRQSCALTSDGKVGTKAFMRYFDNPKGNIPKWLINWAAKTGVPQFLSKMQSACRGYPDYLSCKNIESIKK